MPKVEIKCLQCKQLTLKWPSQVKKYKYGAFCSNKCIGLFRTENLIGSLSANFKTGSSYDRKYISVIAHWHPHKRNDNTIYLHRLIAEAKLGRYLDDNEIVHHKDGNPENNHWSNLEVTNQSNHVLEHLKDETIKRDELGRFKKGERYG
jgi:hypothetical protein